MTLTANVPTNAAARDPLVAPIPPLGILRSTSTVRTGRSGRRALFIRRPLMTSPRRRSVPRSRAGRTGRGASPSFRLPPIALLGAAVVLALFVTGVMVGGVLGGALIAALALAAGALLVARWGAADPRIRTFRSVVVLIVFAVAIVVMVRG